MSRILVLGGGGAVGRVASAAVAKSGEFAEVLVADLDLSKARAAAAKCSGATVKAIKVDVLDPKSFAKALAGVDLVLNCSGPFYKLVRPIVEGVIKRKINYVDICDDVDVTIEILKLDKAAKKAGVTALIGMGSSPGATNLLAKLASTVLLDSTDSIDIFHAHGGEPIEGEGVIAHRFHCMSIDIPMYLDGKLKHVKYFEKEGIALRENFTFPILGEVPLYPYPHPEQVTLPKHIKCNRVTNKGSVLPNEYYNLIRDMCALGLSSKDDIVVRGKKVKPYDFSMAFIVAKREEILKRTKFGKQRGCVSVIVKGKKDGVYREFRFHLASQSQALGEGTGIPAAIGAILMSRGKVRGKGVMPPEACVDPMDFVGLVSSVMKLDAKKEGGKGFGGVIIEQVDERGVVKKLDV